jgi:hypothetical protein
MVFAKIEFEITGSLIFTDPVPFIDFPCYKSPENHEPDLLKISEKLIALKK